MPRAAAILRDRAGKPRRLEPIARSEIVLHRRSSSLPEARRRTSSAGRRNRRRARCRARAPTRPRLANRRPRAPRARSGSPRSTPSGCRATLVSPRTPRETRTSPIARGGCRRKLGVDAGALARARRAPPRRLADAGYDRAEAQPRHRPGVRDDAGLGDRRRDVRGAAHHALPARRRAPIRSMLSTPF